MHYLLFGLIASTRPFRYYIFPSLAIANKCEGYTGKRRTLDLTSRQ